MVLSSMIKRRAVMEATGAAALLGAASGTGSAAGGNRNEPVAQSDQPEKQQFGRFKVEIDDVVVAGWKTVNIPSISIEQDGYNSGNNEKKVLGQPTYDDLEMERGIKPGNKTIWNWVNDIRQGKLDGARKEIAVSVMDEKGTAQTRWEFTNCWPKNYDPPDLDASAADVNIATESLTLAFDKMIRAQ